MSEGVLSLTDDQMLAMIAGVWANARGVDHACILLDAPAMARRARILVTKARKRGDTRFPRIQSNSSDDVSRPPKPTEGDAPKALEKAFKRETTAPARAFAPKGQVPAGGYRCVIRKQKFVDPTLSLPERRA